MSDLGQILISISDKLSKLISRVNKLERNVYKIAKSFEPINGKFDVVIPNSLAKGVYIVQLQTNSGKLNKKIIIE